MAKRAKRTLPRNGKTIREVAEGTGLSTATIARWTSEPREDYLARADARRKKILKLRSQGLTMRKIAAEVGCSPGLVSHYINQANPRKAKITLSIDPDLKAQLEATAAARKINPEDLMERWVTAWLNNDGKAA